MNIDQEAKKIFDRAIALYMQDEKNIYTSIEEMLLEYSDAVATHLDQAIEALTISATTKSLISKEIDIPSLSKKLYSNSKDTAKVATKVINEHIKNKSTIAEIQKKLYDGYGYQELLPIKKSLPKYLSEYLAEAQVQKLKTKALKTAYMELLNEKNNIKLENRLKVALEEKARYYAHRIADTEEARAYSLSNASSLVENGVELVQWRMSSRHRSPCVCTMYATADSGYGDGIYPIDSAPMPVYSTHPFCKCKLVPVYRDIKKKKAKNPIDTALNRMTPFEQSKVFGSQETVREWKSGADALELLNSKRQKGYKSKKVEDFF